MSSGFSDDFPGGVRSAIVGSDASNFNRQQLFVERPPLAGIPRDSSSSSAQIRSSNFNFIGKRSVAESQQNQFGLGFYLRNMKAARQSYLHTSPISPLSPVDSSLASPDVSSLSNSVNQRYGIPILHQNKAQPLSSGVSENRKMGTGLGMEPEEKMMNHRLHELEKVLLGDDDDEEDDEAISAVSNNELSDTMQNLLGPSRPPVSPSPTSSSSSCSFTSTSRPIPSVKESFLEAAAAISDGKSESTAEIFTRLHQIADSRGNSEQRLTSYMLSALKSRLNPTANPQPPSELYSKEQILSIHMLYDVSPCFKLGFMAANLAILDATLEQGSDQIHVVDFDIGQGKQYLHLLHALASRNSDGKRAAALKVTAVADLSSFTEGQMKVIGDGLRSAAAKVGVSFNFSTKKSHITDVNREKLGIDSDETLAINLAFKLHELPDESVSTNNLRDQLLRCVKGLSPTVVTVVEQDLHGNTAPLTVRVREAYEHYGALFDSLEATVPRDISDRVRIEAALGRKLGNSVAFEGRDRVERCEVFGKWRARMRMAGFESVVMTSHVAESLQIKLNSGTRGNPGFTVEEQCGGVGFGWMGRIVTFASAWR